MLRHLVLPHQLTLMMLIQLAAADTQSSATSTIPGGPGRPKIPPHIRIPVLKKKIDSLRNQVSRLKRKSLVQQNLLTVLRAQNQLRNAPLEAMDGCLAELVENQYKNKRSKGQQNP